MFYPYFFSIEILQQSFLIFPPSKQGKAAVFINLGPPVGLVHSSSDPAITASFAIIMGGLMSAQGIFPKTKASCVE